MAKVESVIRSSATWFWWIAGLSLVNSVIAMLNLRYGRVLGLGITQVLDIFVYGTPDKPSHVSLVARIIHLVLVLSIAGFFYRIGVRARQQSLRAYKIGMLTYAADAGFFLFGPDWLDIGFHAFVLFMLWGGYTHTKALHAHQLESLAAANQQTDSAQPQPPGGPAAAQ